MRLFSPAGRIRSALGCRYRNGHQQGDPRANLRAVLYHQGGRQGHRPGTGHGLWHREQSMGTSGSTANSGKALVSRFAFHGQKGCFRRDAAGRLNSSREKAELSYSPRMKTLFAKWFVRFYKIWDTGFWSRERANRRFPWRSSTRRAIDLLLTDLVMPSMGGKQLSQIGEVMSALQTIYMSGYTEDAKIRQDIHELDAAFLQKPFN